MIDLNPAHLAIVERILAKHVPECEVRGFGSRVTWNAKDHSDLDLAVVGEGPLPRRTLALLKEAFEESRLPMRVDVIDWNAITDGFRESIEPDTVVVQDAAPSSLWPIVRLGDCITTNEETVSSKDAWVYINYLDTGNITENRIDEIQHLVVDEDKVPTRARRKVREGDIVYSTVRPNQRHYGLLKDIPENLLASTGFVVIRGKEGVAHTDFVYWLLAQDHIVEYLQAIAEHSTSTYPSIRPSDIEAIEFFLPPLEEQRTIARVLGALDDKIELNRRMSETLEEIARALFQSWFVDFDPVRAKARGQLSGLPPDLDALFPASFEASELGEIPTGWEVKTLGDCLELAYGKSLKADARRTGDIPVLGSNGQVGWHDKRLVAGPGIVVGRKGNPGTVSWSQSDFFPIDTTFYVLPKIDHLNLHFLRYALVSQNLPAIATDSAVPGLNRNLAYMNRQLVPDTTIVDEFGIHVNALFERISYFEAEVCTLSAKRDALLPRLISGAVRLSPRGDH